MEKIKIEKLGKVFGKPSRQVLELLDEGWNKERLMKEKGFALGLWDVSFTVAEGEILVVMGLSGSGKSTLIRCLNRLIEPTAGSILVDGTDVRRLNEEQLREFRQTRFGMVFQRFALFPHRTVLKNVAYGLEIHGEDRETCQRKSEEALTLVGLKGWEDSYPEQLSGGMQQRVGLARALAVDPDILLMDEAFSALDPLIRKEMQEELLQLQSRVGKTIIFITHDLDEALKLGDKIIIMKDGRLVQQGSPEEILTSPADAYVEKFVEDVDMTKVLTAASVMKKAYSITYPKDGPKTALREMEEAGISSIFVVDRKRLLLGIVNADDVSGLIHQGSSDLREILKAPSRVAPETSLNELFALESFPAAVVDESGVLKGAVVRGNIIAGLNRER
jgi:glycine betaine/proline transport system ATP-binding protein